MYKRQLYKETGEKVIILLDEYDVPLENAYFRGFYDEMIDFIRSLFEAGLKTNDALKFSVITDVYKRQVSVKPEELQWSIQHFARAAVHVQLPVHPVPWIFRDSQTDRF